MFEFKLSNQGLVHNDFHSYTHQSTPFNFFFRTKIDFNHMVANLHGILPKKRWSSKFKTWIENYDLEKNPVHSTKHPLASF